MVLRRGSLWRDHLLRPRRSGLVGDLCPQLHSDAVGHCQTWGACAYNRLYSVQDLWLVLTRASAEALAPTAHYLRRKGWLMGWCVTPALLDTSRIDRSNGLADCNGRRLQLSPGRPPASGATSPSSSPAQASTSSSPRAPSQSSRTSQRRLVRLLHDWSEPGPTGPGTVG